MVARAELAWPRRGSSVLRALPVALHLAWCARSRHGLAVLPPRALSSLTPDHGRSGQEQRCPDAGAAGRGAWTVCWPEVARLSR